MPSLLNKAFKAFGFVREKDVKHTVIKVGMKRGIDAAQMGRLVSDWLPGGGNINVDLSGKLSRIRSRCRDMEMNDPHMSKFFKEVEANVVGEKGVVLQMRYSKNRSKINNTEAANNRMIEDAWWSWSKKYCTVDGKFTMASLQRVCARGTSRDGECLIRIIRGWNNPFRFTLQPLDVTTLDEDYCRDYADGSGKKIRFGIEFDIYNRPVAYYLKTGINQSQRERVPAKDIIHYFIPIRINQARGLPWMISGIMKLRMLNAAEFSETVAFRIAASKMGIWQRKQDAQGKFTGVVEEETGEDGKTESVEEMEPGKFGYAPEGYEYKETDPKHPNSSIPEFSTMILRGVAAGAGISAHNLTGDMTKVNYSSARTALLGERELWKIVQNHFEDFFVERIFREWLEYALLSELRDIPYRDDYADYASWTARRWSWVDPQKDITATITAIANGLSTWEKALAEQGLDFYETMESLKKELDVMADLGISLPLKTSATKSEPEVKEEDEEDPEDEDDGETPAK